MTVARSIVLSDKESVYHCISRCVRRAFLYGFDSVTSKDYDHRKQWIKNRLMLLVKIFTIEVLQYAIMDNHTHTMVRTRPDILNNLDDKEIILRWLLLYPKKGISDDLEGDLAKEYIAKELNDSAKIATLRNRLGSISWFMKSLNEHIARMANKEDDCKGRFWEGRFKCVRLETKASLLSCAVYIDLNQIHAGKAETPETSEHTSVYERIHGADVSYKSAIENSSDDKESQKNSNIKEPDLWIAPIHDTENRKGFLPISFTEYLKILDTTGRELKNGKQGSIPADLEPILVRLGILSSGWLNAVKTFNAGFSYFAGDEQVLTSIADKIGKNWIKGLSFGRALFA